MSNVAGRIAGTLGLAAEAVASAVTGPAFLLLAASLVAAPGISAALSTATTLACAVVAAPGAAATLATATPLAATLVATPGLAAPLATAIPLAAAIQSRPAIIAQLGSALLRAQPGIDDRIIRARRRESLDALCWRALGAAGTSAGAVERALLANPGLAAIAAALPEGHPVLLPDIDAPFTSSASTAATPATLPLIQLWD